MTRPKVRPEDRQRTAQACESCKRRKQKCNGLQPCNTCEKRAFNCNYVDRDNDSSDQTSPAKTPRTSTGQTSPGRPTNAQSLDSVVRRNSINTSPAPTWGNFANPQTQADFQSQPSFEESLRYDGSKMLEGAMKSSDHFPTITPNARNTSNATNSSLEEDTAMYSQLRMLEDPTGRLLYVGDSATLSFLQFVRMMVENITGPTPFTTDPKRHRIQENQFSIPESNPQSGMLPNMRTALVLIDSFFLNTNGLIQVFDRDQFRITLDACYSEPLAAKQPWLCLLNLVFAIGLTLATPRPDTPDHEIVRKLRSEPHDRGELFYRNAEVHSDPTRIEDAHFWSVQALLLMSYYMLVKAKRNASFAYLHMAVASGYALGLHKEETYVVIPTEEQALRRNTWRSLFVLDRFISCQLGRPMAISESNCSVKLRSYSGTATTQGPTASASTGPSSSATVSQHAQDAAVHACQRIGDILKRVYKHRKISTFKATEMADRCKEWPNELPAELRWAKASPSDPATGIAILHVNLLYCHSIILLTRPFFLFILNRDFQKAPGTQSSGLDPRKKGTKTEKFSESCLIASIHTVVLIRAAFEAQYLPRNDPFVVYFLLSASLILLSNEFVGLHAHKAADECIQHAITIMEYCGQTDLHASRLIFILTSFRDLVLQQRQKRIPLGTAQPLVQHPIQGRPDTKHQKQDSLHISPTMGTSQQHSQPVDTPTELKQPQSSGMTANGSQWTPLNVPLGPKHPMPMQFPPSFSGGVVHMPNVANPVFSQPSPLSPGVTFSPTSNISAPSLAPSMLTPVSAGISGHFDTQTSLSSFLELSALDNISMAYLSSDDGSGGDEVIEFDTLWNFGGPTRGLSADMTDIQGISDSQVPLFGVTD